MNDVFELMARAANDGTESLELTRRDITDALRAAEKAGWRLVPVEPTEEMILAYCDPHGDCVWNRTHAVLDWQKFIQAAPRPWEKDDE